MRYLLMILLVFVMTACNTDKQPEPTPDPDPIPSPVPDPNPEPTPTPEPDTEPEPAPTFGGTLGESFGDGGKVIFPGRRSFAMAVQADGKIVTFSVTERQVENDPLEKLYIVRRFNRDGTPDKDFAKDGEFIAEEIQEELDATFADAEAVTITDTGRICFVGTSTQFVLEQGFLDFPVIGCLTSEGEPDTTFDGNGFAFPKSSLSDIKADFDIRAADIQIDPKTSDVVIGGTVFPTNTNFPTKTKRAFWLFRMAANGDPNGEDPNSENKGQETVVRFPDQEADFRSFAFLPNGDVLALGSVGVPFTGEGGFDTAIAKISTGGSQQINVFDFQLQKNDFGSEVSVDKRGRAVLAASLNTSSFDSRGVLASIPRRSSLTPVLVTRVWYAPLFLLNILQLSP
jgi:hypothetical protein